MNIALAIAIIGYLVYLQPCNAEIKLVQTLFRHGNRMPSNGRKIYPNDPISPEAYKPEGYGALTNKGKMAVYELGQYFRKVYGDFLGPVYKKDLIWFRADEVDRIVQTGQLVAASLFPPSGEQIWNPDLLWQPIPVWTVPFSDDYLYNGMFCSNFNQWRADIEKTDPAIANFIKSHAQVYEYLSKHAGSNITQEKAFDLRQILYAQQDIGLELPAWTKSVFPNGKLEEVAVYEYTISTRTLKMRQLLGGAWISEWLQNIDNHLNGSNARKAYMYAAHENNIGCLLASLGVFDNKVPSYASAVMFELHKNNNTYFVKMIYKDMDKIKVLKIPKCNVELCPLETFRNIVAPLLPENIEKLCGSMDF